MTKIADTVDETLKDLENQFNKLKKNHVREIRGLERLFEDLWDAIKEAFTSLTKTINKHNPFVTKTTTEKLQYKIEDLTGIEANSIGNNINKAFKKLKRGMQDRSTDFKEEVDKFEKNVDNKLNHFSGKAAIKEKTSLSKDHAERNQKRNELSKKYKLNRTPGDNKRHR